jgi:hypothetical protein
MKLMASAVEAPRVHNKQIDRTIKLIGWLANASARYAHDQFYHRRGAIQKSVVFKSFLGSTGVARWQ